jgi:predicted porin
MQKKLIALAVAALASTGAMAQVTFYGVLDAGVLRATGQQAVGADQKFNGINTANLSGSRLGFTAEEDLGDGLKAVGRAEFGTLNIDNAANNIGNTRQSFVGLSSATAGTLVFGRVQTPGYDAGAKHDALGCAVFSPYATLATSAAGSQTITCGGATGRVNNAIGYVSPKLGGAVVKAVAARNTSELNTAAANGDVAGLGVEFSAGPLDVSGVVTKTSEFSATSDHTDAMIGVNYNLGVAKVMAMFLSTKRDNNTGADVKGKLFQVGVQVPVGKGTVKVAVGAADTDVANTDAAKTFGIDYEHAFGKRTTGFVGVNHTKVGDFTGTTIAGVAASADKAINAFGAGVRLTF